MFWFWRWKEIRVRITREIGIFRRTLSDNVDGMDILQIFYDWFLVVPAFFMRSFVVLMLYFWLEPWIKGKTRGELEQIEHQIFLEDQPQEKSKKEQALHAFLLGLTTAISINFL